MKELVIVRNAQIKDVPSLSLLMNELGYSTTDADMLVRFQQIDGHPDFKTFVAEWNGRVVAFVGFSITYSYESINRYIRILAFIVGVQYRGKKTGFKLLTSVESFATEGGINKIVLTCGNRDERIRAHDFYLSAGFKVQSTGYIKILSGDQLK